MMLHKDIHWIRRFQQFARRISELRDAAYFKQMLLPWMHKGCVAVRGRSQNLTIPTFV